jgi:hypothetical protein
VAVVVANAEIHQCLCLIAVIAVLDLSSYFVERTSGSNVVENVMNPMHQHDREQSFGKQELQSGTRNVDWNFNE